MPKSHSHSHSHSHTHKSEDKSLSTKYRKLQKEIKHKNKLIKKLKTQCHTPAQQQPQPQQQQKQQFQEPLINHQHSIMERIEISDISPETSADLASAPRLNPMAQSNAIFYTPAQISKAYGLDPTDVNRGTGTTVAVIIAYTYAGLQSDFDTYCKKYSLPLMKLKIVKMAPNKTKSDAGWAVEECLDIQMIHSIAPGANILVVEAKSNSFTDLNAAVKYAETSTNPTVDVISMSWGSNEFSAQTTPAYSVFNNPRITYCAAAGDIGGVISFPSSNGNVISVGGTSLKIGVDGARTSETVWTGSGCGSSMYTPRPVYQSALTQSNRRIIPDLSLVADPYTGVVVCYNRKYFVIGGTSVSCPCFAGIMAIANQLRKLQNKPVLTSVPGNNCVQTYLYKNIYTDSGLYQNNFYDINAGTAGSNSAIAGYDSASGLGAPKANTLCAQLVSI